jgi:hypothetical protein
MSSAPLRAKFSLFPIQENVDSKPRLYEEPDEEHQVSEEHQSEQEHLSSRYQSPTSEQESLPLRHQLLNPEQEHLSLSPVPEHKQLGSEPQTDIESHQPQSDNESHEDLQPDNESDQDYRSEQEVQSTTIDPEHPWDDESHKLPQSTNSDKAHPRNYSAKDHLSLHLILDPDQGDQGNEDENEYYPSEEEDQSFEENLGNESDSESRNESEYQPSRSSDITLDKISYHGRLDKETNILPNAHQTEHRPTVDQFQSLRELSTTFQGDPISLPAAATQSQVPTALVERRRPGLLRELHSSLSRASPLPLFFRQ